MSDLDALRRRVADFVESPEGQIALAETQRQIKAACDEIQRAAQIPWELMHKTIGPVRP